MNFAESTIAHRALFRIGPQSEGGADIRTAAVALLRGRKLGVLLTLAALDVHSFHFLLHLPHFWLWFAPDSRIENDLPELVGRLVGAKEGHHSCRLLLVLLDRMNLVACIHEALRVPSGAGAKNHHICIGSVCSSEMRHTSVLYL